MSGPKVTSVLLMSPTIAVPQANRFADGAIDRLPDLWRIRIGPLSPRGHQSANPFDERGRRRHLVAQIRELEMGVRVDETRHHRHVSQLDVAGAVGGRRAMAERDDAAAIDGEPAVARRRLADGQHPGRVVADQWGMTRSRLPAWLLAGYFSSSSGTLVSPSARAVASSSMRGTSRSRKIGSPRMS